MKTYQDGLIAAAEQLEHTAKYFEEMAEQTTRMANDGGNNRSNFLMAAKIQSDKAKLMRGQADLIRIL